MSKNNPPPKNAGNERNEYIPSFISKAPFFAENLIDNDADWLSHQRLQSASNDTLDKAKWYDRGRRAGPAATKYRKGACENCGAMTHKTKECLSRPRKQGAKWTGKDIQADEVVDDVKLGWDAKRDRWNGYDAREYDAVVRDYQDLEILKAANDSKTSDTEVKQIGNGADKDDDEHEDNDEARYGEETDMGRSQPTSTRQLRLREDTAKYLLNLDLDSAKYDPKTRSMDTTSQNLEKSGANGEDIASEGFVRPSNTSDDAAAFERAQRYAWESQENTSSISANNKKLHLQANPTEGEVLMKKQQAESAAKKAANRRALLEKYGGEEYLQNDENADDSSVPKTSLITSSESYAEYDPTTGRIKPNPNQPLQIKPVARSKYAEDQYANNHTSVFGSWWHNFTWGYACCHSTVKNSYCTGEEGKKAFEEAEEQRTGQTLYLQPPQVSSNRPTEIENSVRKRGLETSGEEVEGDSKRNKTAAEVKASS